MQLYAAINEKIIRKHMPAKVIYAVRKNRDLLQAEVKRYEETRTELCEAAARKDDNGDPVKVEENGASRYDIPAESLPGVLKEVSALLEAEVSLDIMTITLDVLDAMDTNPKYDPLSVEELEILDFMIEN